MKMRAIMALFAGLTFACLGAAEVFAQEAPAAGAVRLDPARLLELETWRDNQDIDWLRANVPVFECADREIQTTYYYRWEVVTKHMTYASPKVGYTFTEFLDRPFWSGAYGAISCPAGMQLAEVRWLRDPRYAWDYARYWLKTPGAQPRRYSTWLADALEGVNQVHPRESELVELLPALIANFEGWERERYQAEEGLFWQTGHDDGMEFNINSRQTQNIFSGAPGYRTTLNSYLIADARAIARLALKAGKPELARQYRAKADSLHKRMMERLWDPRRSFFFQRFRDKETQDGHEIPAGTLTYDAGKYAGSPYGRELYNYVPWMFGLVPLEPAYDAAWKKLMDPEAFFAPFGPTTVERRDPLFLISKTCCWWSGQSWPYGTAQTLSALARRLRAGGPEPPVTVQDYADSLSIFARTHRRRGVPYIGEAAHPDTGSWDGHDTPGHSDHYFHSSFNDLVISGLMGLQAGDDPDKAVVHPLIPPGWSHAAIERVRYRGRDLSILWDRDGTRYNLPKGLHVLVNGELRAHAENLSRLEVPLGPAPAVREASQRQVNYAVANDGGAFPRMKASAARRDPRQQLYVLADGNIWYHVEPPNRWTTTGSNGEFDWVEIDLGMPRPIEEAALYLLDDGPGGPAGLPTKYAVEYHDGAEWKPVPEQSRTPAQAAGHRANRVRLEQPVSARRWRIALWHPPGIAVGLSEIELWGSAAEGYIEPGEPAGNLARSEGTKVSASFHSRFDRTEQAADGVVGFRPHPIERWTTFESPNAQDWLELDFGAARALNRVELAFFDDGGGVQPPESYALEWWDGSAWKTIETTERIPGIPIGGQWTSVRFPAIHTTKLRLVLTHAGRARSGLAEIEAYHDTSSQR